MSSNRYCSAAAMCKSKASENRQLSFQRFPRHKLELLKIIKNTSLKSNKVKNKLNYCIELIHTKMHQPNSTFKYLCTHCYPRSTEILLFSICVMPLSSSACSMRLYLF